MAVIEISRTVQYALVATLRLGERGLQGVTSCSELAEYGHMPERFLLQILRCLVTHNILTSSRGVHGGYALARPLSSISILELMEAVEGPMWRAPLKFPFLSGQTESALITALEDAGSAFRAGLSAMKLSALSLNPQGSVMNVRQVLDVRPPHHFPSN
jgi:Rrf2 family protein